MCISQLQIAIYDMAFPSLSYDKNYAEFAQLMGTLS